MYEMHSFCKTELMQNPVQSRNKKVVKIALEKGAILPENYPINDEKYQ